MPGFYFRDANAPHPNRPRRVGVAALIERGDAILLDRRVDPPVWGLVAGAADEDESLPSALAREVAEETGLVVSRFELFGVFSDPSRIVQYADGNTYRVITVAFAVEVRDFGLLHPSPETTELRFVRRDELERLDLAATHRPIIERYLSEETPPFVD
jgi:ADP-ribose pyrophosphatase YjhB (NUDIX family)